jgi:hypothetical protein
MAAVELGLALRGMASNTLTASLWHYAASIGAFCPAMAVLGAKRPQDRGWQWVVLSLWIILLAPAGHALAASTGTRLELSGLWRLMIAALMIMELLNYLPTRHALSALCAVSGQAMLLSPFLWGSQSDPKSRSLALVCLLAAACMALMRAPISQVPTKEGISMTSPLDAFNQRWRLFRDGWGAFWGLRILQRINQTAELSGWPVRLQWSTGFQAVDDRPLDDATVLHIKQMLDSLLRRFERP